MFFISINLAQGRSHPLASLGITSCSASTFFVASPAITRTSHFSYGFWCKFRRKGSQVNVIPEVAIKVTRKGV